MMSPATDGTKAVLPGISRRSVHLCFAPGGQMQWLRQLMDMPEDYLPSPFLYRSIHL